MLRLALIAGIIASLLAPAIARTWDAFPARGARLRPGWWTVPHRVELNPAGQLTQGLVGLLIFDAASLRPAGIQNKVLTQKTTFTFDGTTQALRPTPYGGFALSTSGGGTDDILAASSILNQANWTISFLAKFDGTGGGAGNDVLVGDANAPVEYIASNLTDLIIADSGASVTDTGITMASLNGWTRVTITSTSASPTVFRTYLNGKLQATTNSSGNNTVLNMKSLVNGWQWPVADIFFWNFTLSGTAVEQHAIDPYGTVLRPRFADLGLKGQAATGKKPSLLNLGIGP